VTDRAYPNDAQKTKEPKHSRNDLALRLRRLGKRIFKPAHPGFTVGLLVLFVALIAVVIYLVMQIGTYTVSAPIYRYDTGIKTNLEGESKVFRSEMGALVNFTLHNQGAVYQLTEPRSLATSPLYWQEEERMFVPAMMSIMRPSQGAVSYRTGYYTELYRDKDGFVATIDNRAVRLDEGFLFDGQSVYVFLDDVTISLVGQVVKMPAMSYAIIVPGLRLELYPYGGEPIVEQTGMVSVSAIGNGYAIDMVNDVLQTGSEQILLFTTPSILDVMPS
jgi:hypothetical protein